jgi:hypothetical protein
MRGETDTVARERRTKTLFVAGLAIMVSTFILFLLLVVPAVSSPTAAQARAGRRATAAADQEDSAATTSSKSVPDVPKRDQPLEPSRENPFAPLGTTGYAELDLDVFRTVGTKYGPDWSKLPVSIRKPFPALGGEPRLMPGDVTVDDFATVADDLELRLTSVLWIEDRALATYEDQYDKIRTVELGDSVDEWQVIQIGKNFIQLKHPGTGESKRLSMD